ncbi:MAG: proline--tRNA ligase [Syntrophomonas sp.]|nr:proline--tRNA ligase [Syntrophomonas sp.]MDD2510025.1 proline--tRNA ligase [Syntrophomonas sp.]MDD3878637.1 proline--tRNA ligase [Syntrophomonas sp.]MDD4626098.1 proline--tRNA ligase [Syntrophomonas sp.]
MKASELFFPTLREVPSEAEVLSHQLLLRAGFIRKATAGVYSYLPLANRVLKKIMSIVREEMDRAGGQEVILPIVQPAELWKKSGRWEVYGDEMFRLKDRHNRDFALGPTHEEIITTLVDADVHSYRHLPLLLYQIQNKYRDEIRPRFGLMRGREFIMKDLYSFDIDEEGLDISYHKMYAAYNRIFQGLKLQYRVVEADSGAIGGNESHEFMVLAENGEAEIVYCENCDYGANTEKAVCFLEESKAEEEQLEREKVHTPGQRTIQDLLDYMSIPKEKQIKTLIYYADEELVAAIVRGDRELNEIKFKNVLGCNQLFMADEAAVKQLCGAGFGSLGPVGMPLKSYVDLEVSQMKNFACGANEDDYHFINVNLGRDFTPAGINDIRNAVAGDSCPVCSAPLYSMRGIEVGHIFKLGTKYSEAMEANFLDQKGKERPMVMGCYGIGISRTMAAAVEQSADENGIVWPLPITPFEVIIVPVNSKNEEQMQAAWSLYEEFKQEGLETIIDDRDERAGVKFKDADLIGIPLRITIGPRSLQEKQVEVKKRTAKDPELVPLDVVSSRVKLMLKEMSKQ